MSLGSGTLVATRGRHGLVVTNWHVVRDARGPINVIFPDGFRSGASLLGTDADWDLAALAIWRPNAEPVPLSHRAPQLDEKLSIAGYGSGKYRSASGRCVQYISPSSNHPFEMLELSASARDGDSGGPIFNNQGELAGVLFGAARGRTAGSFCGRVRSFLDSVSPRFDALLAPSTDTMIAQDLPTPAVMAEPGTPIASEVAMARPGPPLDYSWESSVDEMPEPSREPPRRRPLPLASIPAPLIDPPTRELPESLYESQSEAMFPSTYPVLSSMASAPSSRSDASVPEAAPQEAPVDWSNVAGSTFLEQAKSFLAAFGLVAITFQVLRVFSTLQGQTTRRRRRAPARRRKQPQMRRRVVRRVRSW
jgi:serine protease Do